MKAKLARALLVAMTAAACSADHSYDQLLIDGIPLESMCLSMNENERAKCVERIETMLEKPDRLTHCYMSELYTLRNVGVRSYLEVLELLEWYETPEGRARTAAFPVAVEWTKEFADNIEPARDTIRKVRERGNISPGCRIVLALQGK